MDAILTFHALDGSGAVDALPPARFEDLLRGLLDEGVQVVRLRELLAPAAGHRVALTFDDGFRSVADEAQPRLARLGLPALLYAVSERVGGSNRWAASHAIPERPLMGWDELRAWRAQGLDVGAHGATHVPLRRLDEAQWAAELPGCRARLEDGLGAPVDDFAYPYGVAGREARRRVGQIFGTAVTTRLAFVRRPADPLALPRIDIHYLRDASGAPLFAPATRARLAVRRAARGLRGAAGGRAG